MNKAFLKWLKYSAAFTVVIFVVYINELDNRVKSEFLKPQSPHFMSYEQQSQIVINMLLMTEDQSFFNHPGVDFREIARVLRGYVLNDKPLRGASTITQQLIKNTLLTRERTISRKFKEALMALLLELSFDKKFILNRYINSVYLGQKGAQPVRGFENAAQFYFNKKIELLSLEEVATLVALVKGPSYYHPLKHPQRLAKRRQLVLRLYKNYEKIVK